MKNKIPNQIREIRLQSDASENYNLAFSSEQPYPRCINGRWLNEVLVHAPENINFERMDRAPVLWMHDPENVVGVVEQYSLDADKTCRASIRFSSVGDGPKIKAQVDEKVLSQVSVGYSIDDYEIDGDTLLVTGWTPYEISMVSIAADPTVGVGRSITQDNKENKDEVTDGEPENTGDGGEPTVSETTEPTEAETQNDNTETEPADTNTESDELNTNTESTTETVEVEQESENLINTNIETQSTETVIEEKPADTNTNTESEDEKNTATATRKIGEQSNVRADINKNNTTNKNNKGKDIMEKFNILDVARAIDTRSCELAAGTRGGYALPARALTVAGDAGALVGTEHDAGSFIETLIGARALGELGVTTVSGIVGDYSIPRAVRNTQIRGFVDESADAPQVEIKFDQVKLTPNIIAGYTQIGRLALKQSSPDAGVVVANELKSDMAENLEAAVFTKLLASIPAAAKSNTTMANFAHDVVYAQGALRARYSNLKAVMSPATASKLRVELVADNAAAKFWIDDTDGLRGVPVVVSSYIADDVIVMGEFSNLIVVHFGTEVDLQKDDVSSNAGAVTLRAFADMDADITRLDAFKVLNITLAP